MKYGILFFSFTCLVSLSSTLFSAQAGFAPTASIDDFDPMKTKTWSPFSLSSSSNYGYEIELMKANRAMDSTDAKQAIELIRPNLELLNIKADDEIEFFARKSTITISNIDFGESFLSDSADIANYAMIDWYDYKNEYPQFFAGRLFQYIYPHQVALNALGEDTVDVLNDLGINKDKLINRTEVYIDLDIDPNDSSDAELLRISVKNYFANTFDVTIVAHIKDFDKKSLTELKKDLKIANDFKQTKLILKNYFMSQSRTVKISGLSIMIEPYHDYMDIIKAVSKTEFETNKNIDLFYELKNEAYHKISDFIYISESSQDLFSDFQFAMDNTLKKGVPFVIQSKPQKPVPALKFLLFTALKNANVSTNKKDILMDRFLNELNIRISNKY